MFLLGQQRRPFITIYINSPSCGPWACLTIRNAIRQVQPTSVVQTHCYGECGSLVSLIAATGTTGHRRLGTNTKVTIGPWILPMVSECFTSNSMISGNNDEFK